MEIKQIEMVFDLMATGQSLRASCREFSISPATFLRHVNADADLTKRYEQARAECMDAIADEIIEIADDDSDDLMVGPNGRGQTPNAAAVARARLKVDSRRWLLGKIAYRKYGDKPDDGDKTVTKTVIERTIIG